MEFGILVHELIDHGNSYTFPDFCFLLKNLKIYAASTNKIVSEFWSGFSALALNVKHTALNHNQLRYWDG